MQRPVPLQDSEQRGGERWQGTVGCYGLGWAVSVTVAGLAALLTLHLAAVL